MKKEIVLQQMTVSYELEYKTVKNINLRIKADKTVWVSAPKRVTQKKIEEFLLCKEDWIVKTIKRLDKQDKENVSYFTKEELCTLILSICERVYPYFEKRGISYPQIKFRSMVSRWGSCHFGKGILTFNTNLRYAPVECIEYVVLHEFTHFLQANHSAKFYEELSKVCPDFKQCRNRLKEIGIPK